MTNEELIEILKKFHPSSDVFIQIPEEILDDGYVPAYRTCPVDGIAKDKSDPRIYITYDRDNGVIE